MTNSRNINNVGFYHLSKIKSISVVLNFYFFEKTVPCSLFIDRIINNYLKYYRKCRKQNHTNKNITLNATEKNVWYFIINSNQIIVKAIK